MSNHKVLLTILCIDQEDGKYIEYCNKFINDVLQKTNYDILVTTNKPEEVIKSDRIYARDNITDDLMVFSYVPEHEHRLRRKVGKYKFNCTLKFLCFENIPNAESYDIIFYIDSDCGLEWDNDKEQFIVNTLINGEYDIIGTRMGDTLGQEWDRKNSIYNHKKAVYGESILPDNPHEVGLPSEHFLIFKNDATKIEKFAKELRRLNSLLQKTDCVTWGESYELGIALYNAGYRAPKNIYRGEDLGIVYNKYNEHFKINGF